MRLAQIQICVTRCARLSYRLAHVAEVWAISADWRDRMSVRACATPVLTLGSPIRSSEVQPSSALRSLTRSAPILTTSRPRASAQARLRSPAENKPKERARR